MRYDVAYVYAFDEIFLYVKTCKVKTVRWIARLCLSYRLQKKEKKKEIMSVV